MEVTDDTLFDDTPSSTVSEGDSATFAKTEQDDPKPVEEPKPSETGEVKVETPSTEEDEGSTPEKQIPEHRFKAALKDVTEARDKALKEAEELRAKIAEANPIPTPDRDTDPDGYELHVRIETSKAVMMATHSDYEEAIAHYQEMVKDNPYLNEAVAKHPVPAQHAYNIAKRDLEIKELMNLKDSDDWKEFQEFKKQKAGNPAPQTTDVLGTKVTTKVPNINRVAAANSSRLNQQQTDDDLFAGAL